MTDLRTYFAFHNPARLTLCRALGLAATSLVLLSAAFGQEPQPPKETVMEGYAVHQSLDLGGRVLDSSGSPPMFDTLVNLHSGPRILGETLDMHALPGTEHPFFDSLLMSNSGYGGDPNDVTSLRLSKGRIYNFQGLFRRDRQYFDYDLLDNPLVPAGVTSNGYTFPQAQSSPHLFNTVRRMTDVDLTLFPISGFTIRTGYSQGINQGPSYSSQHNGAEGLYLQTWRNSTDTWLAAVDWKPVPKTLLTFEEDINHYKGDTNWQLANPLPLQLSNGTPVSLGFDNVTAPSCGDGNPPIITSATTPPTANSTCSGYIQYTRSAPTRTLSPTEQFRFHSSSIKNVDMTGDVRYTGTSMNLPAYDEFFYGLDNMGKRAFTSTGYASAERVAVSADYGITWQILEKLSLAEQFDFLDFRSPAASFISEVDLLGNDMLLPPGPPQPPAITFAPTFFGTKKETSTTTLTFEPSQTASISLGYRYQQRFISWNMPLSTDALPTGTAYTFPIFENAGILGFVFQPTRQLRVNARFEASYDDHAYTQVSPRQFYRYHTQTRYKPREWATITATFDDAEGRDNVTLINHLDHNRNFALAASLMPAAHYGFDFAYGYSDVFSRTTLCYASPVATGPGAGAAPPDCGTNTNLGTGYYDAPAQYGQFGFAVSPLKKVNASAGYRVTSVNGTTEFLNPLQVYGSLQSKYQSPYADVTWILHDGWSWKGSWNFYDYGENGPAGPTAPRNFHADLVTLALRYQF